MKILAIRGANLASLEGEFALDLEGGPLARAGVFAICGPTGAGKSTLLDAMCLALFDTAPRVASSSRVRVGRDDEDDADRLTTSDPRTILRKGAGQGFAEVDFRGVDGRAYRARWEVRRARGRASGRLQHTTMSLVELESGAMIAGGRKTDVKEAIEERLGLTFDQFRRSVLLAQGDFAAFLDADAKERAGLLERMTGTEIYGAISKAAHERAVRERQHLEELRQRGEIVTVLGDEERADLEGRLVGLDLRAREEELAARQAEQAMRWHAQLAGFAREEAQARTDHENVVRQLALAESRRRELEAYSRALPVQRFLEASDRAAREVEVRSSELARSEDERVHAEARAAEARRAYVDADARAVESERALADARPALSSARVLDRELAVLHERVAELEAKRAQHAEEARIASERRRACELELAGHREAAERARAWLEQHPSAASAAARWDRHSERLARVVELTRQHSATEAARLELSASCERARESIAEREESARLAREAAEAALARWREAESAARAAPSEALAELRSTWVARRAGLEEALGVAAQAESAHVASRRHREAAERAAVARDRALARAREADELRSRARAQLEEARRTRDRLRSTLDLAAVRAELREGEACPVCGSTEHPFAHREPVIDALLDEQDARIRELASEVSELEAKVAEAHAAAEAQGEKERESADEAAEWGRQLASARERYASAARSLGPAPWPDELPSMPAGRREWGPLFASVGGDADGPLLEEGAHAALVEARDEAVRALDQLDAEERARRERERRAASLREEHERARERAEAADGALREALAASERAASELDRVAAAASEQRTSVDALVEDLSEALSGWTGWRERLASDADAFVAEVEGEVQAWLARAAERDEAEERARSVAPSLGPIGEQDDDARKRLGEVEAELARAGEALSVRRAERAAILGGADPDAHERALVEAVNAARDRARAALDAATSAERSATDRASRASRASEALEDARRHSEQDKERLATALRENGLDEADARARLAHDPSEIDAWRRALVALDTERDQRATVLAERTRRREAHEAEDPPRLSLEDAKEALARAVQRQKATREELAGARVRLAQDDEQRARAAELAEELEAQRARIAVWDALADLIGSATGAKLRVFAQSLTLELLLEHANVHLAELAPRYALARVPGEDLALMVIDREMGDEVRSVSSLSGGESFLVALGMALGLASMSSQRARIDSLFIDEGFGALDPASLDLVLSTLDRLQASGRQVGVISHVPAMAERFDTRVSIVSAGPARSRVELVEGFA